MFSTTRITTKKPGKTGSGTGFFFEVPYEDGKSVPFIVTNKHVVKDAVSGTFTFHKIKDGKPDLGNVQHVNIISEFEKIWFGHPDNDIDICVTPLLNILTKLEDGKMNYFHKRIVSDLIPNSEVTKELDAYEDIIFVGYPSGIWDSKNFTPIIRRGSTATHPAIDYENKKQFLIDASVFPGSSGSPVFLYQKGMIYKKNSNSVSPGQRIVFLGIIAETIERTDFDELKIVAIPTETKTMIEKKETVDLGIVLKSELVLETVNKFIEKNKDRMKIV